MTLILQIIVPEADPELLVQQEIFEQCRYIVVTVFAVLNVVTGVTGHAFGLSGAACN